ARAAAAATRRGGLLIVRALEGEAGAHQAVLEVDLAVDDELGALAVDEHLEAVELEHGVVGELIAVERHAVAGEALTGTLREDAHGHVLAGLGGDDVTKLLLRLVGDIQG